MDKLQKKLDELLPVLETAAQRPDADTMVAIALSSLTRLRNEIAVGQISSERLRVYATGLWRNLAEDLPWTEYGLGSDLLDFTNKLYRAADKLK